MEQSFIPAREDANADVYLCLFPYLKQFLAFDAREGQSRVMLLSVDDVLGEEFYRTVETEISEMLRESSEYPLAHLMNLPGQIEETVRGVAVTFILDRIGIRTNPEDPEDVMVFAVGGGGPAAPPDVALQGLQVAAAIPVRHRPKLRVGAEDRRYDRGAELHRSSIPTPQHRRDRSRGCAGLLQSLGEPQLAAASKPGVRSSRPFATLYMVCVCRALM